MPVHVTIRALFKFDPKTPSGFLLTGGILTIVLGLALGAAGFSREAIAGVLLGGSLIAAGIVLAILFEGRQEGTEHDRSTGPETLELDVSGKRVNLTTLETQFIRLVGERKVLYGVPRTSTTLRDLSVGLGISLAETETLTKTLEMKGVTMGVGSQYELTNFGIALYRLLIS